ncbi:hypothetical protein [Amaricoccus solimangrovi]|uniref:Ead/Ea22-like family protein n=1 Tax=Amaricoccus solimangrovi TaxID=2589815 RepID=A0A501WHH9_9RHOB|nr:hypothetical protein [Amaricoccus solimangrovi]TPE45076.1 hypothetical protein FJM51_22775 [Amaricoccus solimangrovi]
MPDAADHPTLAEIDALRETVARLRPLGDDCGYTVLDLIGEGLERLAPESAEPDEIVAAILAAALVERDAAIARLTAERDRALEWRDHDKERAEGAEAENKRMSRVLTAVRTVEAPQYSAEHAVGWEVFEAVVDRATAAEAEANRLRAENEQLLAALTPSAETKAAYIGEIKFITSVGWDGVEYPFNVVVPWDSMKQFMALIRSRASTMKDGNDAE